MKKIIIGITSLVAAALIFTGGAYANQWLNFTGDETVDQSGQNVDEIMAILRDVGEGKKSAEDALEDLEGVAQENEQLRIENGELETDLAAKQQEVDDKQAEINEKNRQYDDLQQERDAIATERDEAVAQRDNAIAERDALQDEIDSNGEYIKHLEGEIQRANEAVESHGQETQEAVEEAREISGE